jgi:hypothetical protein
VVKCGRRRDISGKRRTCPYERGHTGDCKPVQMLKDQLKYAELSRLIGEHLESECPVCVPALAGDRPERCTWTITISDSLTVISGRMDADGVELPDCRDEDELRKAAQR